MNKNRLFLYLQVCWPEKKGKQKIDAFYTAKVHRFSGALILDVYCPSINFNKIYLNCADVFIRL
jgi:hypothetical protein